MAAFEITTNAREYGARLRGFPTLIEKHITPAIDSSAELINLAARRNIRKNESMASSHLITSLHKVLATNGLEAEVQAQSNYAEFVEFGTKGGYRTIPPIQSIIDWMGSSITPDKPGMSKHDLAYLIARNIATNGTAPQPFMRPAFESEKDAAMNRINAGIAAAIAELSA